MENFDPDAQKKILNRLKRAQGQLTAVITAVENDGDCRDVVTQLSAVTSALGRAGFQIIATAMKECLSETDEVDETGETKEAPVSIGELEKLFMSLA